MSYPLSDLSKLLATETGTTGVVISAGQETALIATASGTQSARISTTNPPAPGIRVTLKAGLAEITPQPVATYQV